MRSLVKDINWNNNKYIRAGIIPIIIQGGIKFYGFGIEEKIASIGDFGGHRETKDKDALDTAIREYSEEALDVFGKLNREMLQELEVLDGVDTAEILLPLTGDMYQYTILFREILEKIPNNNKHEVQNVIWLSREQLLKAIDCPHLAVDGIKLYHMYYRIRDTLILNKDLI